MKFDVIPFLIINYEEFSVAQNYKNINIINDKSLIKLLNRIDTEQISQISEELIFEYFGSRSEEAIKYMLDKSLICEKAEIILKYNKIILCSNDEKFLESFKYNSEGINIDIEYYKLDDKYNIDKPCNSDELYLFFLNRFNYKNYKNLVKIIKEKNILAKISFFYNNKIYVSNYYKKSWYNPCPLCYFSHVESSIRAHSELASQISYQTILELIYKEDIDFKIENKFSNSDILVLINTIIDEIKNIRNVRENEVKSIDYMSNSISYDTAIHWELCDCYE